MTARPVRALGDGARLYAVLALSATAVAALLPLASRAPNRLLSGRPVPWDEMPPLALVGLALALAAALAAGLAPRLSRTARAGLALGAAILAPPLLLSAVGQVALQETAPLARIALGSGAWAGLAVCALLGVEAARRLPQSVWARAGLLLLAVLPTAALLASGALDGLAVMREYATKRDEFSVALLRHGEIVLLALLPTLAVGLPLGIALYRRPALKPPVLGALGLVQTIPSIALFGLLMVPLSGLAARVPGLAALGISGIGLAPGVLALMLYALLPIARNTAEGLTGVPAATLEAARGMGMSARRIFWQVSVPLALPALLAGLRITLVQTLGLAAVTALIGAGGLGALMFQGISANAESLVLLGAVPLVALALSVDALFRLLAAAAARGTAP